MYLSASAVAVFPSLFECSNLKGFKTHKEFVKWALALLDGEEWAKKKADELSAKKPR